MVLHAKRRQSNVSFRDSTMLSVSTPELMPVSLAIQSDPNKSDARYHLLLFDVGDHLFGTITSAYG